MATFIKLVDRTVQASIIRQLRRGLTKVRDPKEHPRAFDPEMITVPALFLDLTGKQTLTYVFDTKESRDDEFDRIEAIILPKPQVLFNDLLLVPEEIQGLKIGWSNVMQTSLKLDIRVAGGKSYQVFVNRNDETEWARAEQLVVRYGLSIPKTTLELLADKFDEEGNLKSEGTF